MWDRGFSRGCPPGGAAGPERLRGAFCYFVPAAQGLDAPEQPSRGPRKGRPDSSAADCAWASRAVSAP